MGIKKKVSARLDEGVVSTIIYISKDMNISITDILELSVIDFISKLPQDLTYEGIDFKEYAQEVKREKLRRYIGKKRNEFLSMNLLIARITLDVWKILTYNRKKTPKEINNLINHYLTIREKETKHYKDNETVLKDIADMRTYLNKNPDELKNYVGDKISDINYLKEISLDKK